MQKQDTGTSTPAPEHSLMLNWIKMLALLDPHHMYEAMQKVFPFSAAIPGLNLARLTEIGEKSACALADASNKAQRMISITAAEQSKVVEECISETLRTLQQISVSGTPKEAVTKQTELVAQIMEKLSKETIELMTSYGDVTTSLLADMRSRYLAALNEMKEMVEESKTSTKP